jgi:hypothetical protein
MGLDGTCILCSVVQYEHSLRHRVPALATAAAAAVALELRRISSDASAQVVHTAG